MKKSVLFVMIVLIVSSFVFPQNKNMKFNLEQCVKLALENNHDLKQAKLDKAKAEEQIRQTYGESLFPSIEGIASYSRALKLPQYYMETPFFSGTFTSGTDNSLTAGIQLEQPLFTGAMFLAVKIAKTYAEIADYSQKYSEAELVMKVKDAYYTYLLSKEYVNLAEVQLKRADENLAITKAMFNAGRVSEYDFIRANVQYQNFIPGLTEAKNQQKLSFNNLLLLMGLDLGSELVLEDNLKLKELNQTNSAESIQKVYGQNFLLKQVELQNQLNDYNVSYSFAQHYPELKLFGNWQTQAQENNPRDFFNWRYKNSFSIGLNLRVPIFKGFSIDSKVQQAQIDLEKSNEELIKTKNNLQNELENTLLTIKKTREQITSYQSAVEQTERGYQIAQKRYSAGMSSQLEITDALVEVTRAKVNYLNSLHQYYLLNARLDLILGKSLQEITY